METMQKPRWFEEESPIEAITPHGEIRFYPEAKRFQISQAKYKTLEGEVHHGKTVTLSTEHFKGNEEVKIVLKTVLESL